MKRWLPFLSVVLALHLHVRVVSARPDPRQLPVIEAQDITGAAAQSAGVFSLSSASSLDTVWYGGTYWAPDSMRWEALRDSVWTFDTGVGSSINTGFNPNKPAGLHQTMEGWFGIDQTIRNQGDFRRSSTCAISGSFSAWAGVTLAEANALCFAAGQGYGNSWSVFLGKTFIYPGSGNVSFSYQYAVESEPGYDYAYVFIDTTGGGDPDMYGPGVAELVSYNGLVSGTANLVLRPGFEMRSTPGPVRIWFYAISDGSYSDEDGLFASTCGHSAFDNITLSGAINDFSNFESGIDGWSVFTTTQGDGDFSDLRHRGDIPPPLTFCPCAIQDSVLVFFDPGTGMHSLDQDNLAVSPWIDLKRGGDAGRPGRVMSYSVYAEMPIRNYVFVVIRARYGPIVCPYTGGFADQGVVFYYGEAPYCTAIGSQQTRDYSTVIPATAEQVQVAYGVVNLIRSCDWGPCDGFNNTTPYLDNIRFGVYGPVTSPIVTLATTDRFQDNFATDGTLNPASAGRLDAARLTSPATWTTGARLGDTLVARGNGGNTEVRLLFQVRPGPFTNGTALTTRAARWTPEPSITPDPGAIGGTWYSARLDTAEQAGVLSLGNWMATFHESDPGFLGTDRSPDPIDASQLENEILPDHILTPGSRVDYFVQSRYIPPDPRNVGGTNWFLAPDTSGRCFYEAEILPSSMGSDSTWNCTLYVDHHDDREFDQQKVEEAAIAYGLGAGLGAPGMTLHDRYDVASTQVSLGRPVNSNAGMSIDQMFGYRRIAWMAGSSAATTAMFEADATLLNIWLTTHGAGNAFWATGDGFATALTNSANAANLDLLNNVLGVTLTCSTIRDAACPAGTVLDSTYCLPLTAAAGAVFAATSPMSASGNGCPDLRRFDVLSANGAIATAAGNLNYMKNGAPASFASVTNLIAASGSKTVVDGVGLGNLRATPGNPNNAAFCSDPWGASSRAADVLGWFGAPYFCPDPAGTSTVPDPGSAGAPPLRPSLAAARPNPSTGRTTISFVNAVEGGRVTIQIFDVTGRIVKTLMDSPLPAGRHETNWDGTTERASNAAAGLYFYRMTAGGYTDAKRFVLVR